MAADRDIDWGFGAALRPLRRGADGPANVRGLQTLRSAGDVELDPVTLGQRLEAFLLDRREMHEHVFPAILRDETETLGVVEPLDRACSHFGLLSLGT